MSAQSVSTIPATEGSIARRRGLSIPAVWLRYALVPLAGLVFVLFATYGALTERTYSRTNGVTGPLLPHHSAGQSFVARYNGLSGVSLLLGTNGAQAQAGVTLHLRTAPDAADIATVAVTASELRGVNPWHTFSFPAIPDSAGHNYYVKVESPNPSADRALSLFWWNGQESGDSYPSGNAFIDGIPQPADLAFGLRYSPSPGDLLAQLRAALPLSTSQLPVLALLLLLAVVGLLIKTLRMRARPTLLPNSVLTSLIIGTLVQGFLYALLVPPWQGPDEFGHFAYAALLDRHGLDNRVVQSLDWQGKDRDAALIDTLSASMTANRFTSYVAGFSTPGTPITLDAPSVYAELRQPPAYYWLSAAAWRTARHLGLKADPYANPVAALRVMRLVSVLMSLGVVALAWLAGRLLAEPDGPRAWLPVLLPLTVLLIPMRAFVDSVANNDVMAELAASALAVAVIALVRWPRGLRGLLLTGLVVALAIVGAGTKSSALAASVPLAGLGIVVAALARFNVGTLVGKTRFRVAGLGAGALVGVTILGFLAAGLVYRPLGTAAGWKLGKQPIEKAAAPLSESARAGERVLFLAKDLTTSQQIEIAMPHPDLRLSMSGYARLHSANGSKAARAVARLEAAGAPAARADVKLDSSGTWQPFNVTLQVPAGVPAATIRLFARDGGVELDDFSLSSDGLSPVASLLNPSFEQQEVALAGPVARFVPQEARWMAEVAANPQTFDRPKLWAGYADGQFKSFWGNFGWVSIPLPGAWFLFWLLVCVLTLLGVLWKTAAGTQLWSWRDSLRVVALLALALAIIFGFARQTMLLSVFDVGAYPQGRYLFTLAIPLAYLFLSGLSAWSGMMARWWGKVRVRNHKPEVNRAAGGAGAPAWLWVNLLVWFAVYALCALVIPYFYG
jgi:hypothetical protein